MTCVHCEYQWCWICEQEYQDNHYTSGKCKRFQYIVVNNLSDIENYRNYFGLHTIFRCVFPPLEFSSLKFKYLILFIFWFIGYGFLYIYIFLSIMIENSD